MTALDNRLDRAWSRERADRLLVDALGRLDRATLPTAAAGELRVLAQAVVRRAE